MQPPFPLRKHLFIAAGVCLFSLGLRLLFLFAAADKGWPHANAFEGDAVIWAKAMEVLAKGELPDDGVPHRFYAIAYLLHWLHPEGGLTNFVAIKVGWSLLSALGCGGAYLVFVRNFAARVAWLATALLGFSFGSYVLATSLNVEGLYVPLLIPAIGAFLELRRGGSPWWLAGLLPLNAFCLLVREEHLVLLFGWSVYLAWGYRRDAVALARRWGIPLALLLGSVALCLPYSIQATRATIRYNTVPKRQPIFDSPELTWSAEAKAFVNGLPAFVRFKTADVVGARCRQSGLREVTPGLARSMVEMAFGGIPEPLSTPVFIASHGPMSFALANHPQALGAFSRAGLATDGNPDPKLSLSNPRHLRIFNHGYAVGLEFIGSDPLAWIGNVFRKWGHAYQGMALGFTGANFPLGRYGERRAVDLLTPDLGGVALLWYVIVGALLAWGLARLWRNPSRGTWLIVLGHKLLVVTFYYGYARQGVALLPVVLLCVALGVDAGIAVIERHLRRTLSPQGVLIAIFLPLIVAVNLDVHAARNQPTYEIVGPTRGMAEWGEGAYSANAPIRLREKRP